VASFDVVVIGGGHAGIEAAHAAARLGCSVALCVLSVESVGLMPCNPAIGGTAKGHLVREIDALGGLMGRAIDATGIQFKLLNRSRGPAVWSPRAQADKKAYGRWMQAALAAVPGIAWLTTAVEAIDVVGGVARGVRLASGEALSARAVVLTTGTFLDGVIHVGREQTSAGRRGEPASRALAASLRALGIRTRRLKTGTPPRVHRASVDATRLEVSRGDECPVAFSFTTGAIAREQVVCFNTRTTARSHAIVREAIGQSPLYNGQISGIGPRYCPSLEDKVMRFEARESHLVVLEPEGLDVDEVYLNGMSMSLPRDVQESVVRSLPGLESAAVLRHGYAVEYDAVYADELDPSLQSRRVGRLWLAGQVNGTSGYEEAAAQGLVAGVNAARSVLGQSAVVLGRQDAYIGVLVNDLSSTNQLEPYRMFTSRAEHRLLLRADNADLRLTPIGRRIGLVDDERWAVFEARRDRLAENRRRLASTRILVGGVRQPVRDVVKRQDVRLQALVDDGRVDLVRGPADGLELLGLESDIKYEGYLKRHEREHQRASEQMTTPIPASLDLSSLPGLSRELRQRLSDRRPASLADARSVPGMTPAALALIGMHARRRRGSAGEGES
jgi:tRNA uridine 5-carboxymethylaminomethyl modification enzyme